MEMQNQNEAETALYRHKAGRKNTSTLGAFGSSAALPVSSTVTNLSFILYYLLTACVFLLRDKAAQWPTVWTAEPDRRGSTPGAITYLAV